MNYLINLEETLDTLILHQTMLNRIIETKCLNLESEGLSKTIESLGSHLLYLQEAYPDLKNLARTETTRGIRYRIQSKMHTLQKLSRNTYPWLLLFGHKPMHLRKRRLEKRADFLSVR